MRFWTHKTQKILKEKLNWLLIRSKLYPSLVSRSQCHQLRKCPDAWQSRTCNKSNSWDVFTS